MTPQPSPSPADNDPVDAWGLPIPKPPSWLPNADPDDDLGYCAGDDPDDDW